MHDNQNLEVNYVHREELLCLHKNFYCLQEYEEKRKKYTNDKEKLDTLKENVKKLRQEQAPMQAKYNRATKEKNKVDQDFKDIVSTYHIGPKSSYCSINK